MAAANSKLALLSPWGTWLGTTASASAVAAVTVVPSIVVVAAALGSGVRGALVGKACNVVCNGRLVLVGEVGGRSWLSSSWSMEFVAPLASSSSKPIEADDFLRSKQY
jgi:hypothetical protein